MTPRVWLPAVIARSGVDVFTRRLAAGLRRAGVDVTLTWLPRWREYAPALALPAPPRGTTLVHSSAWSGRWFAGLGAPLVVTWHSASVRDPSWHAHASPAQRLYYRGFARRWEAATVEGAAALTAVSNFVAHSVAQAYGRAARVIPNWVDTALFAPAARGRREGARFRLLFVGNLTRRKGADTLARVGELLGPRFEITCVGQRGAAPRGLRLPDNVVRVAPVADESAMAELYRQADAVIVPSRSEGFGFAALEALACGCPVVASGTSALPEIVRDGETGILCPPEDGAAFAAACRRLADDAPLARRMAQAARDDVLARFTESRAIGAYLDVYAECLGGTRPPG